MTPLRTLAVAVLLSLTTIIARGADDSFVGKWKFNPDKSQLNGIDYKFEDAGTGALKFVFGDDSETIRLDGKDHPTKYGSTWALSSTGKNSWKFTQKRGGKITSEDMWKISDDDQTFMVDSEAKRPDGTTSKDETTLKRTAGSSGLVGSWETSNVKVGSPTTVSIAKWEDGFSLSNPTYKETLHFKFDDKERSPNGPRVAPGTTVSAKKGDDKTVTLTYKLKGKVTETDEWKLSDDGKTLTDTITYPGVTKQELDVYDRE